MKVYTRRGDRGQTDLFGGPRVDKDASRVEAYGAVDELNSCLGVCAAATEHADLRELLEQLMGLMFDLGAYLASPDAGRRADSVVPLIESDDVLAMEARIDAFENELEPLRTFILPGGTHAAAALHLARTVCRRAERRAVSLHHEQPLDEAPMKALNRLSDLLFVMARIENCRAGVADVPWEGRKR